MKPTRVINEGCTAGFRVLYLALEVKLLILIGSRGDQERKVLLIFKILMSTKVTKELLSDNLITENWCHRKFFKFFFRKLSVDFYSI